MRQACHQHYHVTDALKVTATNDTANHHAATAVIVTRREQTILVAMVDSASSAIPILLLVVFLVIATNATPRNQNVLAQLATKQDRMTQVASAAVATRTTRRIHVAKVASAINTTWEVTERDSAALEHALNVATPTIPLHQTVKLASRVTGSTIPLLMVKHAMITIR